MFSPQRSVEYARELLSVAAMVAPGYSELRAYLSHHAATPLYWLVKGNHEWSMSRYNHNNDTPQSQYVEGAISRGELVSSMEEVWRHLELVTRVWGGYRWDDMMMT